MYNRQAKVSSLDNLLLNLYMYMYVMYKTHYRQDIVDMYTYMYLMPSTIVVYLIGKGLGGVVIRYCLLARFLMDTGHTVHTCLTIPGSCTYM